jgi:pantothenate kinase
VKAEITSLDGIVGAIRELLASPKPRVILGIVGKPGAGKSTVTEHIFKEIDPKVAALVPMDGYHYSNKVLADLGRSDRKGAPDTFDSSSFIQLLKRVKNDISADIYFPIFHREIEESIAAEGMVPANTKLIVTEGNYLLMDDPHWQGVRELLDESWYLEIPDSIRHARLIARHEFYGRDRKAAEDWALGTDERNAKIIGESSRFADRVVRLEN